MHVRLEPMSRRFSYRVISLLIDLDRLDAADRQSALFGVNRAALYSFDEADHGARDGSSLTPPAISTPMRFRCGRVSSALPGCCRRRKSALPLVTFKIVVAIHWEALRLWLKGARLVNRPAAAAANTILAAGKRNDYTGAVLPAAARRKPDSALVH